MWNRRNEDTAPKTPQARPTNTEPFRQPLTAPPAAPSPQAAAPVASKPAPPREAQRPVAGIGPSVTILGEIFSAEDLFIDGEVEGLIDSQSRVTIGENGKVKAHVRAKEVVIMGAVTGNVEAGDKITIRQTGSLIGDIKCGGIVVDDGAYFKGSIDIVKAPPIVNKAEEREAEVAVR
jgi:cytoskeletal protein CcmA (bactofilin family)